MGEWGIRKFLGISSTLVGHLSSYANFTFICTCNMHIFAVLSGREGGGAKRHVLLYLECNFSLSTRAFEGKISVTGLHIA